MLKNKIFLKMAERGIRTLRELSGQIGLSEGTTGRIARGETTRIDLETIEALCRVLDCQPGDFLEYVPDESPD